MLHIAPSEKTKQRAQIIWEQSQSDFKVARSCIKENPEKSTLQSTQAAINALSSVLERQGYFQLPAFSAMELLNQCIQIDPDFEALRAPCHVVDGILERDLFGHSQTKAFRFTPAFAQACMRASHTIQKYIKAYWKEQE